MSEVRFSIIIQSTRGAQGLTRMLKALGDLDYPSTQFEVIVADSSSQADSDAVGSQLPPTAYQLTYLPLKGASRPQALNIAVRESAGAFLAFLDEDCIPAPDWLYSYDKAFDAWLAGIIGGALLPPKDGDAYQKCLGLVHGSLARSIGLVTGQQVVGRYYPRSSNMAARKEAVVLSGGFDEHAVECPEIRMVLRMQHIGYRTFYCPDAVVQHYQHTDFLRFLRHDFRTAAERARFCRHSGINLLGIGVVALLILMLGLAYDANTLAGHAIRLTAGGYLVALAISSLHAAMSAGSIAVAVFLPLFLAMHHIVYVIGLAFGRFTRI